MKAIVHTDVVVLGGGSSGVAAAVASAKAGLQVVLIERNSFLGVWPQPRKLAPFAGYINSVKRIRQNISRVVSQKTLQKD